ncbi:C3HC4 zinc finger domain-containing protein [Blastomyces dermatitidis ATCC 18188]|uniref:C3HC4 zinc finger domain-containing protein n=2 Tax=Ajellomyces dermatitidis (strain ATCC 18188 / CBS 674.68) TaxID=653446 RepID=F2T9A9_AJEDA|nr:C3HC4 zinc finger domain-containing protein [Blastomyces dermatitidis ATCC 18188]
MSNCPPDPLLPKCMHKNASGCQLPCPHFCCLCAGVRFFPPSHPCPPPYPSRDGVSSESQRYPRYCLNCKEYWASQAGCSSSAVPVPVSGACMQPHQPHPHCGLPVDHHRTAPLYNYQPPQNLQLNRDIGVSDHSSNSQSSTAAAVTAPSQRFPTHSSLQQSQNRHPHRDEFHQQTSWIPRHVASNSSTFGQAIPNPSISHHRVYMPVNQAGMAGRQAYTSPGAAMPANLQASVASESASYSLFSNQQSQGQTPDQVAPNSFWEPNGNYYVNGPDVQNPSRDMSLSYNYAPAEPSPIYYSTSLPSDPVTRPFATVESRQQGNLEQNNDTQVNSQNQGLYNPISLNHDGPVWGSDLSLFPSARPHLFPRVSNSSTLPNNDNPLNSLSFQYLPDDYHNAQVNSRGSTNIECLNGNGPVPILPHNNTASSYPVGPFPTENQANASNSSRRHPLQGTFTNPRSPPSVGSANPNTTTTSRRRPRRTNNSGMPQPGSMPRERQPHRHNHHPISIGIPGSAPTARDQSYVNGQLARLLYAGALVRYPNDTDGFLSADERERRRRILESLRGNNREPSPPVKGLDSAEDGRPEPKETEELTINLECKACMSQLIDTVVLPCGHAVLCRWCADQHMPSSRMDKTKPRSAATCPVCRQNVRQKIRIYLS